MRGAARATGRDFWPLFLSLRGLLFCFIIAERRGDVKGFEVFWVRVGYEDRSIRYVSVFRKNKCILRFCNIYLVIWVLGT